MTFALINTQITIITYIIFGFVLYKVKIIDPHAQVFISDIMIDVLLPASVFASVINGLTIELLINLGSILAIATGLEIILFLLTKIPIGNIDISEANVNHYGMLVSNGGLVGTPVIESLFGAVGVMSCNVFLIPTRVMAFSAGESIFNPQLKRTYKDILYSIITNKIINVMTLGIICVFLNIIIPDPIFSAISKIGNCLGPFSLMLIGSMLAQYGGFEVSLIKKVLKISIIRLFIIPLAALAVCLLCKLDFQSTAIIVLLMGMPVGSTCASFSKKYKGNEKYATNVVLISTLASTITLVILMRIIEMFF